MPDLSQAEAEAVIDAMVAESAAGDADPWASHFALESVIRIADEDLALAEFERA